MVKHWLQQMCDNIPDVNVVCFGLVDQSLVGHSRLTSQKTNHSVVGILEYRTQLWSTANNHKQVAHNTQIILLPLSRIEIHFFAAYCPTYNAVKLAMSKLTTNYIP